jgi:hypothetical protein
VLKVRRKASFKDEGEIEAFPDKQEGRDYVSSRWGLQKMLKGVP